MTENQQKIVIGSLLHDIGKILYRSDDGRNHSESGYDFLKNEVKLKDQDILDQVRYHHSQNLRNSNLKASSYIRLRQAADNPVRDRNSMKLRDLYAWKACGDFRRPASVWSNYVRNGEAGTRAP